MQLNKPTLEIIDQMIHLVSQLNRETYSKKLEILSGNTLGKHIRHILEFFMMISDLKPSQEKIQVVSYDTRNHDVVLETIPDLALDKLKQLKLTFNKPVRNINLKLAFSYQNESESAENLLDTSLHREIMYNIEHAIHHMAIIKIAINHTLPEIQLPENFGVAYSTIRYHKKLENVYR